MDAQEIRESADMVPMAVGYGHRIDNRRHDAELFHIAEEDVTPGAGIEQQGMPGSLHQTGESPVGPQGRFPHNIIVYDRYSHGTKTSGYAWGPRPTMGYRGGGELDLISRQAGTPD